MSDVCSDGRTKMQHIIHTLTNIIMYFKENSVNAIVSIYTFDDKIYKILERSTITEDNFQSIILTVQKIRPLGNTNIQLALEHSKEIIPKIKSEFPEHNISHIFMTDGAATSGNSEPSFLSKIVDTTVTNAFIGFGIDHDSVLLNTLGSEVNCGYYFVDKLENSGFVYGEVLHSILYKLVSNITISVENGLVYDFKNNAWTDSLLIGDIASESNKIYHIISLNPNECRVTFAGKSYSEQDDVLFTITGETIEENLNKYLYRQRTLQHLFNVNDYLKRKNVGSNSFSLFAFEKKPASKEFRDEEIALKEKLVSFITEMKKFMADNNLTDDGFMKNLCDDIYICYRTFETVFGAMYIAARQTSQGTQRAYTVRHTPNDIETLNAAHYSNNIINGSPRNVLANMCLPNLRRQNYINICDDEQDILQHEISDLSEAPYLTATPGRLMRDISCNSGSEDVEQLVEQDV